MLRLERVDIGLIWPDPNNPRENFEGLDELIAQFAYTPERPGEPMTPPLVVADGTDSEGRQKYRIVDGERRYQAMLKAKTETCMVNVADTLEEAMSVAAMLATDDKQPLTAAERSKGVQQMLALGVQDEAIDTMARMKRGSAAKVRRVVGDAGRYVQGSLDDLMRIAELDDEETRRELVDLLDSEERSSFSHRFYECQREQRDRHALVKFREVCEEVGIPIERDRPEGMVALKRVSSVSIPDDLREQLGELDVACATIDAPESEGCYYSLAALTLWGVPKIQEMTSEEIEAEDNLETEFDARINDFMEQLGEHYKMHEQYMYGFVECMKPLREYKSTTKLRDLLWHALDGIYFVTDACEQRGRKLEREYPAFMIPMLWDTADLTDQMIDVASAIVHDDPTFAEPEHYSAYLEVINALEESGFTLDEFERETRDACERYLKGAN